ncbi:HlyD family efflux transporter periplasmic adaptor subunit [Oleiagrimonas sp. C23AA]|uniref:HlyD family secretion protein n=1 Tax=Oleiagrimonas sp. C23AA TaxID=2719047 RepID=UPI00141DF338|nr:HlyD family efflux transporter periplasmic adaptor subunit [Oleiagrimonas sp. C23AA]NII11462.1 HlyD family efflux transporter periplasmic adaptor subunit [Oleiagrimonas sp. C23AA]
MNASVMRAGVLGSMAALLLSGCHPAPPKALGTLEYDRITLPAVAAERVVSIGVKEGQRVKKGQFLVQLDASQTRADLAASRARAAQQQAALEKADNGPRKEDIDQARARLASANAQAKDARAYYARLKPLQGQSYVSASDLDRARAAASAADGDVAAARAALDLLLHGTRAEDVAQARAALADAQQQAKAQQVLLDKLHVVAPRDGLIDSLPYRRGDQAPVGQPLVIMLVGHTPYARVYLPEAMRAQLHDGDAVQVHVRGRAQAYAGHVRMIRREPVFTPYYALSGEDATRLSWLAQVQLGNDARDLPAGLPVSVTLAATHP